MKSPQPTLLVVLVVFAIVATYYKILPTFFSAPSSLINSLSTLPSLTTPPSFCTKEIGEGVCCELHLGAEPCLDECRKNFMDRQSFALTKEYDECADQCLVMYRTTCGKGGEVLGQEKGQKKLWDVEGVEGTKAPRARRSPRRQSRD
ncbi:hypothetical protein K504DRAFT_454377 [Pleomassaria siparia CBS 279.74]|uniref:Uncharacterized protein n=1 Tax=Pleomassaria siparia CBS 279.74 TaxID=1314801 RepID=A0A6G1KB66_9PLEO|nr:hypothetical protein K504DRAFT_454377 [Pleomassaria siparia CBS 279.74]